MIDNAASAWVGYLLTYILTPWNVDATNVDEVKAEVLTIIQAANDAGLSLDEIEAEAIARVDARASEVGQLLLELGTQAGETEAETFLRTGAAQYQDPVEGPSEEGGAFTALGTLNGNLTLEINHYSAINPVTARAEIEAALG